jgi:hypothetical protein
VNVLPYDLGVALGADWDSQSTVVELSGNFAQHEARGIVINARIGSLKPVLLVFAWTKARDVPLLLGQVNFFAEFDVCFYGSQYTFEVRLKNGRSATT